LRKQNSQSDRQRDWKRAIDLHQLACFISAAELGTLSAAAAANGLSQPAITVLIGKLEEHLGVQLFYRDYAGVDLTPAGSAFLSSAKATVASLSLGIQDLRRFRGGEKNRVRLGMTSQASKVLLTSIVEDVVLQHGDDIELVVEEAPGRILNRWLEAGDLDIAFSNIKPVAKEILSEPVVVQQFHLVGLPEFVKDKNKPITFAELDGKCLVQGALDGSNGRRETLLKLAEKQRIKIDFEIDSPVTIRKQMMRTINACTVSFYFLYLEELARGEFAARPIKDPVLVQLLYLSRRKARQSASAENVVYELVKSHINRIVSQRSYRWHPPSWLEDASAFELI
jgi:DNA-binding transcriptional LysR family regulator